MPENDFQSKPAGPGWYRGDFHAHTTCSDGIYSPQELMDAALGEGLDFLAITDHNSIAAFEQKINTPILIVPGIEVTLLEGHFNIFGLNGWPKWLDWFDGSRYCMRAPYTVSQLLQQARSENLVTSVNHPLLQPWEVRDLDVSVAELDCIENWNDPSYPDNRVENPRAVGLWTNWLNAGYRVANIGGSDFHSPFVKPDPELPAMRVGVPVTVVYAQELSVAGILEALRQRRAYFSMGPQVEFSASLDGSQHLMGSDLGQASGTLELNALVQADPGTLSVRLVRNGQTTAEIQADVPIRAAWRVALDPQEFAWHRVDVLDSAGRILAVTNPIFSGPAPTPGSTRFGDYVP